VNNDGTITTPAELLDSGKAYVEKAENFHAPRSKKGYCTKYFVTLVGDDPDVSSGWEIGKMAYESRASKGQDQPPEPEPITDYNSWLPCRECDGLLDSDYFCILCGLDHNPS
jgi:hypothetical protein